MPALINEAYNFTERNKSFPYNSQSTSLPTNQYNTYAPANQMNPMNPMNPMNQMNPKSDYIDQPSSNDSDTYSNNDDDMILLINVLKNKKCLKIIKEQVYSNNRDDPMFMNMFSFKSIAILCFLIIIGL